MASNKYFVVKKTSDGTETLVGAPRANLAKIMVVGGKVQAKPATEEQIILHFQAGHSLHVKSRAEGDGKMFLLNTVPPILVRAKNAGESITLTDDSTDYEITQASHETIVRLMTAGASVLTYTEESKVGIAAAPTGDAVGNANAGDGSTEGAHDGGSGAATGESDANDAAGQAASAGDTGAAPVDTASQAVAATAGQTSQDTGDVASDSAEGAASTPAADSDSGQAGQVGEGAPAAEAEAAA